MMFSLFKLLNSIFVWAFSFPMAMIKYIDKRSWEKGLTLAHGSFIVLSKEVTAAREWMNTSHDTSYEKKRAIDTCLSAPALSLLFMVQGLTEAPFPGRSRVYHIDPWNEPSRYTSVPLTIINLVSFCYSYKMIQIVPKCYRWYLGIN